MGIFFRGKQTEPSGMFAAKSFVRISGKRISPNGHMRNDCTPGVSIKNDCDVDELRMQKKATGEYQEKTWKLNNRKIDKLLFPEKHDAIDNPVENMKYVGSELKFIRFE
jgi:hypothetical protein